MFASFVLGSALVWSALLAVIPTATSPSARVLDAFASTWATIDGYSATLTMHETSGNDIQDRTYALTFEKPSSITMTIVKGPGRGGKVVWSGGDSVLGSPPGLFSGLKVRLALTDPKVTSLRGDTVDMASFGWILNHFEQTPGTKTEAPGDPADGATTAVTLAVGNPSADGGITQEMLVIANATKLPVEIRRYVGATLVKDIHFSDVSIHRAATN
jgi:outer membrane lipoprotein-sorting protein